MRVSGVRGAIGQRLTPTRTAEIPACTMIQTRFEWSKDRVTRVPPDGLVGQTETVPDPVTRFSNPGSILRHAFPAFAG